MPESNERYTLRIKIEKLLEISDIATAPAHKVEIESNGLTLEEVTAMQKELAPPLMGFLDQDAPQG